MELGPLKPVIRRRGNARTLARGALIAKRRCVVGAVYRSAQMSIILGESVRRSMLARVAAQALACVAARALRRAPARATDKSLEKGPQMPHGISPVDKLHALAAGVAHERPPAEAQKVASATCEPYERL